MGKSQDIVMYSLENQKRKFGFARIKTGHPREGCVAIFPLVMLGNGWVLMAIMVCLGANVAASCKCLL